MATRWIRFFAVGSAVAVGYCSVCDVYAGPLRHVITSLDGENAHRLGLAVARLGIIRSGGWFGSKDSPVLRTNLCGLDLASPVGLAAGFDKDAVAVKGLFTMGFAAVEVGSVTPEPQPGNPRPRVFRLEEDRAIINRYGFNSAGVDKMKRNLIHYDFGGRSADAMGVVGVNVGKNRNTPEKDSVADYVMAVRELGDLADYLVVNVSSPNTPGLRDLQGKEKLRALLVPVLAARDNLVYKPPVFLKIAPDLTGQDKQDIADVALDLDLDGLIISNTTLARPEGLVSENHVEHGGLSGKPLRELSTAVLYDMYQLTGGRLPLIGVGGVESGEDAYEKIKAGASFVQLYSALVFDGPWVIKRIKDELAALLERDGYSCVSEAVGAAHRLRP